MKITRTCEKGVLTESWRDRMMGVAKYFLVLACWCACVAHAAEKGIAVSVATDKDTYFLTEPVKVTLSVKNNYKHAVTLRCPQSFTLARPPAQFFVKETTAGGGEVPLTPRNAGLPGATRAIAGSGGNVMTLRPGQSATVSTYLNMWYELRAGKEYRVSCRFKLTEPAVLRQYTASEGDSTGAAIRGEALSNSVVFQVIQPTENWPAEHEQVLLAKLNTSTLSKRAQVETVASLIFVGSDKAWEAVLAFLSKRASYELTSLVEKSLMTVVEDPNQACTLAAELLTPNRTALKFAGVRVIRTRGSKRHAQLLRTALDDPDGMVRWSALRAIDALLDTGFGASLKVAPVQNAPEIQRAKAALGGTPSRDAGMASSGMLWGVAALIAGVAFVVVVVLMVKRKRKLRGHGEGQESS